MVRVYLGTSSLVNAIVPGSCILDNEKRTKELYRLVDSFLTPRKMRGTKRSYSLILLQSQMNRRVLNWIKAYKKARMK
jgi:hypothetical protein